MKKFTKFFMFLLVAVLGLFAFACDKDTNKPAYDNRNRKDFYKRSQILIRHREPNLPNVRIPPKAIKQYEQKWSCI